MSRVKINLPSEKPLLECKIPLRITDMNYGNHLGNDKILSLLHEARVQLLNYLGCTELDLGAQTSLIMADVMVKYVSEAFYGDDTYIQLWINNFTRSSFQVYYRMVSKNGTEQVKVIAEAKTGMVCFDYQERKVQAVPESFIKKVESNIK